MCNYACTMVLLKCKAFSLCSGAHMPEINGFFFERKIWEDIMGETIKSKQLKRYGEKPV